MSDFQYPSASPAQPAIHRGVIKKKANITQFEFAKAICEAMNIDPGIVTGIQINIDPVTMTGQYLEVTFHTAVQTSHALAREDLLALVNTFAGDDATDCKPPLTAKDIPFTPDR